MSVTAAAALLLALLAFPTPETRVRLESRESAGEKELRRGLASCSLFGTSATPEGGAAFPLPFMLLFSWLLLNGSKQIRGLSERGCVTSM